MDLCKNYKAVIDNFSDDRLSPSFMWHLKHGPGHLFGKLPGSEYYRSNRGIKCSQPTCKTTFGAEKEMVRHMKYQHPGKSYKRTPNSRYCFRVDITKITDDNYDKTQDFLLPNVDKSKKKSDKSKSGPEGTLKKTPKPKKTQKRKSKRFSETNSDSPIVMDSSPGSSAVDADVQAT